MAIRNIPGDFVDQITIHPVAANAGTGYVATWRAPFKARVLKVEVEFLAAVTGHGSNRFNLNLDDDDRSTELDNHDFSAGNNAAVGTPITIYEPSGGKLMDAGDSLYLEREDVGSSPLMPAGMMVVTYQGGGV